MRSTPELNQDFVLMFNLAKRMARRYGSLGTTEPDDVAHNAMIKLLNRAGNRPPTIGWLYKTVRSAATDAARAVARERAYVSTSLDGLPGCVCERADELGMVYLNRRHATADDNHIDADQDKQAQLTGMLAQLTEPLKQVLILSAQGMKYEQIAEATGTKVGTVRSRLHYARKRAKELLDTRK